MFRTVLVHVDTLKGSDARTRLAVDLARQFEASLIGIAAGLPRLPIEIYDVALGTVAVGPDYTEFDRRHVEAEFGKAAAAFKQITGGSGLETDWRAVFEAPSVAIVRAATAADIVVVGPGDVSLLGEITTASPGDIVLQTGRPVLVAPEGQDRLNVQNVLVAWKDTPEAQRAIADAVPFMKRAARVVVATVQEGKDAAPPELADATGFLLRHGITAMTEVITGSGPVEDRLLDFARSSQCDLIVAGAYGHSRLREWAFGGVTRGLLIDARIPCLLSH